MTLRCWTEYVFAYLHFRVILTIGQQKRSLRTWNLLSEFVRQRQELEREVERQIAAGEKAPEAQDDIRMPQLTYVRGTIWIP